ncbi:uncharacterized protein LOC122070037 [Macadamia integrifolia]|uniref:uncharacterized protein LOC122070037 n=1 Tax=Macadamia integrifolia TaxID=60698 RepID=UPI001C4EB2E8|nr:uncharacterized protein LOC122070037 [Macadamia integrifolia]
MADTNNTVIPNTQAPSLPPITLCSPFHIPQIMSKTYVYWKTQIVPYLIGQRLYDYVSDDKPRPQDPTQAASCREKDASIMSLLTISLSDDGLFLALGCTTNKEIWDAIHVVYSSTSTTCILSLHVALQNLIDKPDKTITQFLHHAKALSDELATIGKPLPLEDFNIHIFRSLRNEYQSLVLTMMAQSDLIRYTELHGLLMSHEFFLHSFRAIMDPLADASVHLSQQGRGNSSPWGHSRGRGFGRSNTFAHNPCKVFSCTNHQEDTYYYR